MTGHAALVNRLRFGLVVEELQDRRVAQHGGGNAPFSIAIHERATFDLDGLLDDLVESEFLVGKRHGHAQQGVAGRPLVLVERDIGQPDTGEVCGSPVSASYRP